MEDQIRELLPRKVADALDAEGGAEFFVDMGRRYLDADEVSRADIRAFFESDGPAKLKDAHERLHGDTEGT